MHEVFLGASMQPKSLIFIDSIFPSFYNLKINVYKILYIAIKDPKFLRVDTDCKV